MLTDDPAFIKDLLHIHDQFLSLVNKQFTSNALFQRALKDAFVELVNRDPNSMASSSGINSGKVRTAELISSFCDRLLKTNSAEKLSDEEIEEFLTKTVQLFSYLTDKDVFADVYRNQFAKR